MSETKFTPGPWKLMDHPKGISWVEDSECVSICDLYVRGVNPGESQYHIFPNAEANAKLITASPKLFDLAVQARDCLYAHRDVGDRRIADAIDDLIEEITGGE